MQYDSETIAKLDIVSTLLNLHMSVSSINDNKNRYLSGFGGIMQEMIVRTQRIMNGELMRVQKHIWKADTKNLGMLIEYISLILKEDDKDIGFCLSRARVILQKMLDLANTLLEHTNDLDQARKLLENSQQRLINPQI
jgi:hypothetical protein